MTEFNRDFFRKQGRKGGRKRRANHTSKEFSDWGRAGAAARWKNHKKKNASK